MIGGTARGGGRTRSRIGGAGLFVTGLLIGVIAAIAAYGYQSWMTGSAGVGPKLQRECVSLVDTVLAQENEPAVERGRVADELSKRGVVTPTYPKLPELPPLDRRSTPATMDEVAKGLIAHDVLVKLYEEQWEKLRGHPAYNKAWEVAFKAKRDEAIRKCVRERARREDVAIP